MDEDNQDTGQIANEAERLTRKIVNRFEGDDDVLISFLLLIDIFESHTNEPVYLNALLGTIRHLAFGMSSMADE